MFHQRRQLARESRLPLNISESGVLDREQMCAGQAIP